MPDDALLVAATAVIWCVLHSWYIALGTQEWLARRLGRIFALQRLAYVIGSTLSLAALWHYWRGLPARQLFVWAGPWQGLRILGLAAAIYLFISGAKVYDNHAFIGMRQLRTWLNRHPTVMPPLSRQGILQHIRHPYYTATFLVIVFASDLTDINLVWRGVFFLYVIAGTHLEERKLVREFGETYRQYQREVPRFLPRLHRAPR